MPELFESRFAGGSRALYRISVLLERLTFWAADAVISTNESYRQAAITRGGLPPDRVRVVRSAPDLARFVPVEPDPALKRGKRFLACYLGVMGPQDGVDYALRALAHLHGEMGRDDLHATFIGSGDAFDESVALASRLGLDGVVEFTGRVPDETVQAYLSTADVCLSPDPKNPLNDVSSMNKVVEYMAMGRPLVSFELHEARVTAEDAARLRARQRRGAVRGADRTAAGRPGAARANGHGRPAPSARGAVLGGRRGATCWPPMRTCSPARCAVTSEAGEDCSATSRGAGRSARLR